MAEPFIGEIRMVGFNFAPIDWARCDGQLIRFDQNPALASILGGLYGGDGRTTFALPDLRGRVPVHPSPQNPIGNRGGLELVALTSNQMAKHSHTLVGTTTAAGDISPADGLAADTTSAGFEIYGKDQTAGVSLNPATVSKEGNGESHINIQPSIGVLFCIALKGFYPARS